MRSFSARESEWQRELDGIELAGFWPRAFAFAVDWTVIGLVMVVLFSVGGLVYWKMHGHTVAELKTAPAMGPVQVKINSLDEGKVEEPEWVHLLENVLVPVLYFGTLLWRGKGQTPGKRLLRIRVVSIVHPHLTFWHCVERALGYGAAALEGGFGFIQFFLHPYRRCAQDRLAEIIVVTERSYQTLRHKFEA